MKSLKFFISNNFFSLLLFCFAVLICQFAGNRGVFPIDSFAHYDSGFRVLKGEHPFKDYWVVSGPLIDYIQSLIFSIFGTSWQSYLLNASLFNGILSLSTYYLLINLGLKKKISFFYSICFAILAYPSSGTPFVDHHSTFLSLLGVYALILSINTNKSIYWYLIPFFMLLGFLSKQVPAAYILFSIIIILFLHLTHQKRKDCIKILKNLILSSVSIILLLIIFFKINSIKLDNFIIQYLYYPTTIGEQRYKFINYDIKNIFLNYKFIYFSLIILFILSFKNLSFKMGYYKDKNFKIFFISLLLFISLVQHMLITKNQIYIFFLIPIFLGLAHIQLNKFKGPQKKYLSVFLIILCIGVTSKYHFRFNIDRKFHELNYVDFTKTIKGQNIDKKLIGLNWITPENSRQFDMKFEIELLQNFKEIIKNDDKNKMVITNYSIFSSIGEKNISGFSRWYPGDNSAFPIKGNKYYETYKGFIISSLKKNKIKNIYILPDVSEKNLTNYVNKKCLSKQNLKMKIIKYSLNENCSEFTSINKS